MSVSVVERDPGPPDCDGDAAFVEWERRSVPQFRQAHAFTARARNLLLEHAPEVVDRLLADGIEEMNVFKDLAPPETWLPEDDAFTGLGTRRPAVRARTSPDRRGTSRYRFLVSAVVSGLLYDGEGGSQSRRVNGVTLVDGRKLAADVVLDCGGRRSPVTRWLADAGIVVPEDIQECGVVYYTRYARQHEHSTLPRLALFGVRGELDSVLFMGFGGDHDTYGIMISPRPEDEALRALRNTQVWEAVARWRAMALEYDAAIRSEADAVYRESAANDRARAYRSTGRPVPDHDRDEVERQDLITRGVMAGSLRDLVLGRALLRRINLVEAPDAILDDPDVPLAPRQSARSSQTSRHARSAPIAWSSSQ